MGGGAVRGRLTRRSTVKYMLLIYGNEELWHSFPQEEMAEVVADTEALQAELKATGEFVAPTAWPTR